MVSVEYKKIRPETRTSVSINTGSFCNPSLGPTSTILTFRDDDDNDLIAVLQLQHRDNDDDTFLSRPIIVSANLWVRFFLCSRAAPMFFFQMMCVFLSLCFSLLLFVCDVCVMTGLIR